MGLYYYQRLCRNLKRGFISHGGRNFLGRICVYNRGGGRKRLYRLVDFFRRVDCFGYIARFCYDCNRSALLAWIVYFNGLCSHIIPSDGLNHSDIIYSGVNVKPKAHRLGWAVPLGDIKLFSLINNIESRAFQGSTLVRSAGCSALLIGRLSDKAIIKLSSGWQISVQCSSMAAIGAVSNSDWKYFQLGSAGKKRNLGFRPKVRGVAKNPCDHPHGGGNGKKSKKPCPVNRFGLPSVGRPTKNKQSDRRKRRMFKKLI